HSEDLPHHEAGFSSTDAHGARNTCGHSVAERLQVGAFDKCDDIEAARHCMDLLDHRTFQFHTWEFFHQILHAGWFCLDQNVGLDHVLSWIGLRMETNTCNSIN